MTLHRAIILNGLQELSNASETSGNCRVTFEANGREHWLSCYLTKITMDWPFASAPADNPTLKACFGNGLRIEAWDPDGEVTFLPESKDVNSLIAGIDATFQDLYGLGPGYTLTYRVDA